jgi:ribonuclease BN (tRNA processing enzyme)
MKIQFVGTGSAGALENWNTSAVITFDSGKKLLIDCGDDTRHALYQHGYRYNDITDVYLSHLHGDHSHGLEWLGFCTKFDPRCSKPNLYVSRKLVDDLWGGTMRGGMSSLQNEVCNLGTYYNVVSIEKNGGFVLENTFFNLIQVVHIMDGFDIVPSFGLMIHTRGGKRVFLTVDTQFCPHQIKDFYKAADVIFHDCECTPFLSGVHANFSDLITLDDATKKKLHLIHYQDCVVTEWDKWQAKAADNGIVNGFVKKGQIFEIE